jgi:hypothetical protein
MKINLLSKYKWNSYNVLTRKIVLNSLFIDYGLKELKVNLKENIITNVIVIIVL